MSDKEQSLGIQGLHKFSPEEAGNMSSLAARTRNLFLTKMGLETGPIPVMLHVRPCVGYIRNVDGTVAKKYAQGELAPYPLHVSGDMRCTVLLLKLLWCLPLACVSVCLLVLSLNSKFAYGCRCHCTNWRAFGHDHHY